MVKDLEILPLMNLFVVLIPMLLLSAVFLEMSVVRMSPPAESAELPDLEGDRLLLAVTITPEHYIVEGIGIETNRVKRGGGSEAMELREILERINLDHPENQNVMILSEPATKYETIVRVMDITRESGAPRVSLLSTGGIAKERTR